jgi:hypothetical protein
MEPQKSRNGPVLFGSADAAGGVFRYEIGPVGHALLSG